jgi:hypothetical protein
LIRETVAILAPNLTPNLVLNYAERIKPVDPERFQFAFRLCDAAAAMRSPSVGPRPFAMDGGHDGGTAHAPKDRAMDRAMLAVKTEFPDPVEFESMSFRLLTFAEIMDDPILREMGLIRPCGRGGTEIHPAIIVALAIAPFHKSGELDRSAYFALVKSEYQRLEAEDQRRDTRVMRADARLRAASRPRFLI